MISHCDAFFSLLKRSHSVGFIVFRSKGGKKWTIYVLYRKQCYFRISVAKPEHRNNYYTLNFFCSSNHIQFSFLLTQASRSYHREKKNPTSTARKTLLLNNKLDGTVWIFVSCFHIFFFRSTVLCVVFVVVILWGSVFAVLTWMSKYSLVFACFVKAQFSS